MIESAASGNLIGGTVAGAGNVISGNGDCGLRISGATGNTVQGNYIGLDAAGTGLVANTKWGVMLDNGANANLIGTNGDGNASDATEGNVIAGGSRSVLSIQLSNDNVIAGNLLGTNAAGTVWLGGGAVFIPDASSDNRFGTDGSATAGTYDRNLLDTGMSISGGFGTVIAGNYIGTNVTGNYAIGNPGNGVTVSGSASGVVIGGTAAGEGNVISGNGGDGAALHQRHGHGQRAGQLHRRRDSAGTAAVGDAVGVVLNGTSAIVIGGGSRHHFRKQIRRRTSRAAAAQNTIQGNYIGTNAAGTAAMGNQVGVAIDGSPRNTVCQNVILGNADQGILIEGTTAADNQAWGNTVGLNAASDAALPNGVGVEIAGTPTTSSACSTRSRTCGAIRSPATRATAWPSTAAGPRATSWPLNSSATPAAVRPSPT